MKHIFSRCRGGIKAKYPAMMDSGPRFDWRSNQIATPALRAVVAIFSYANQNEAQNPSYWGILL